MSTAPHHQHLERSRPIAKSTMNRLPFLRWFQPPPEPQPEPTAPDEQQQPPPEPQQKAPYYPTVPDVLKVRHILRWKIIPDNSLPVEIVDLIIDEAEYWPSVETTTTSTGTIPRGKKIVVRQDQDRIILRSEPLCLETGGVSTTSKHFT